MTKWWREKLHNIAVESFTDTFYLNSIYESKFFFRHGIKELLEVLYELNKKLYVVSAGIEQIIDLSLGEVLEPKHHGVPYILANAQAKSEEREFKDPLISTTSKNRIFSRMLIPNLHQYAILLGDTVEDTLIPSNVDYKCVLNIGFFNNLKGDPTKEDEYYKHFDIVVSGDGSLMSTACIMDYIRDGKINTKFASFTGCNQLITAIKQN